MAYGLLVAWQLAGASSGQELFIYRVELFGGHWPGLAVHGCALLLLFSHLGMRIASYRARHEELSVPEEESGWLHAAFGLLGAALIVLHSVQSWAATSDGGAAGLYVRLGEDLGRPEMWVAYVVGITSLAFYAGAELRILVERAQPGAGHRYALGLRLGAIALPLAFWLMSINALSCFVMGQALLSQGSVLQSPDGVAVNVVSNVGMPDSFPTNDYSPEPC